MCLTFLVCQCISVLLDVLYFVWTHRGMQSKDRPAHFPHSIDLVFTTGSTKALVWSLYLCSPSGLV